MILYQGIKNCVIPIMLLMLFPHFIHAQDRTIPKNQKNASTDSLRILTWRINMMNLQHDTIIVDTLLPEFQLHNPVLHSGTSHTYLGNLGLPSVSNAFIERKYNTPFLFAQTLDPFLETPEKTIYYNTHRPYTNIKYTTGISAKNLEESVNLIHTQNVNPKWNVGIDFNVYASLGMYPSQRTKDRTFTAHSNYQGEKYTLHFSYHFNHLINQENGGLINDSSINNKDQDYLPVNLEFAKNKYITHTVFILQSYDFGGKSNDKQKDSTRTRPRFRFPKSTLSLLIRYDWAKKVFEDDNLTTLSGLGDLVTDSAFFRHFYFNKKATNDSIVFRKIYGLLKYSFRENAGHFLPVGVNFMLSPELLKYAYYNKIPTPDSIVPRSAQFRVLQQFNIKAGMSFAHIQSEKVRWEVAGFFTFAGYDFGNYLLRGQLYLIFPHSSHNKLILSGSLKSDRPDFFYSSFSSNHIKWNNSLKNVARNEASAEYCLGKEFTIGVNVIHLNRYIFFNDSGYPAQTSRDILVTGGQISKTFHIWKWVSVNKVIGQYSTDQRVLPLPAAIIYLSDYLEIQPVRNVLFAQIGLDVFYNTQFYGYAYDPVTGCFHTQHEKMIGNYPYVDVFLNLKLKRTRFYFKYEHVNFDMLPRQYFNALHYPMDRGVFRFGLSWAFYD